MENLVKNVCREMLHQRGYNIDEKISDNISSEYEVDCIYAVGKDILLILFSTHQKFNIDIIQEYVNILHSLSITHSIIVHREIITPVAKKLIQNLTDLYYLNEDISGILIETFLETELRFNITKHSLVPQHILLSNEEADEIKKNFGTKFPVILTTDPISRFFLFQRGNIIKVIRKSGYITYRIVR